MWELLLLLLRPLLSVWRFGLLGRDCVLRGPGHRQCRVRCRRPWLLAWLCSVPRAPFCGLVWDRWRSRSPIGRAVLWLCGSQIGSSWRIRRSLLLLWGLKEDLPCPRSALRHLYRSHQGDSPASGRSGQRGFRFPVEREWLDTLLPSASRGYTGYDRAGFARRQSDAASRAGVCGTNSAGV